MFLLDTDLPSTFGIYNNIDQNSEQLFGSSLPSSIQACVGSYLSERQTRKQSPIANDISSSNSQITGSTTTLANIFHSPLKSSENVHPGSSLPYSPTLTPPNDRTKLLSHYLCVNASPYSTPMTQSLTSHGSNLKTSNLLSTSTLIDSITPPQTPISVKHIQPGTQLSPTYRTEMTILPSFTHVNSINQ